MTLEGKIMFLGKAFRGLWRCHELKDDDVIDAKWCLTFDYKGVIVETPLVDTAHQALDFALKKLGW